MPFQPMRQQWPSDHAILLVHGVGNARPGDYAALVQEVTTLLGDGAVDVAAIKQLDPDLVVLDPILGREDFGWGMTQQLKRDPDTADVPILVCTGATGALRQVQERLTEESISVVLKPFDIDELLRAVDDALAQSRRDPRRPAPA